ncbi:MAG: M23 family metallopeptidase [Candidatus Peribacteraceae bacterium]|nr:M23 family metallopeptidase [Candidatus Peribacteraceae bacterium]MDD5742542.1 M23 family metallopeptidase [Candidatus Peribacteraceae bacterium]
MLHVEIEIPHPVETLFLLFAAGGVVVWMTWKVPGQQVQASVTPRPTSAAPAEGEGGPDRQARMLALRSAEDDARRIRTEQTVLSQREEILRYELKIVEDAASRSGDGVSIRIAKEKLLSLLADERAAEEQFRQTLQEMWEAEGLSATVAVGSPGDVRVLWPVEPEEGLSALFLDAEYEKRFGIPHHAIDIPVAQGSAIRSAADGVVDKIVDNGLGYSYILVKHDGFATLYGHASAFFVAEGDHVRQGDVLAASGGMPGTPGAGSLTTGPHLHFEVIVNAERIDPLTVLPARPEVHQGRS